MKKFIITMLIIILVGCVNANQDDDFMIIRNQNKRHYYDFKKRTKWFKSFQIIFMSTEKINVYNYRATINKTYDIASITKTFTAFTILMLHEEKKLNIDHPVKKYISNFYDENVTIRHLITHSAFKPYGQKSSYSNINYVLLKDIIEEVTGNYYYEEIYERFFKPLQMYNSTAKHSNGAGNIFSTIKDLSKYTKMLINKGKYKKKEIISPEVYASIFEPTNTRSYLQWYWGSAGWEVFTNKKREIISYYKSGRWYYSISGIEIFTKEKKAIIYIGEYKNCLQPWISRWRNWFWRYLRTKI